MAKNTATNVFTKMMGQDVSSHMTSNETYRYAKNGRIKFGYEGKIYAGNETPVDGETGAFSNERGTKPVATLCDGYDYLASADINDHLVIFSTNGKYSEIGRLRVYDDFTVGQYETLYNDEFDPHKELLNFKPGMYLQTSVNIEFPTRILVYWRGDDNEPRVFNYNLAFDEKTGERFHKNQCGQNIYPRWLCSHSMNRQLSVRFSKLAYVQTFEKVKAGPDQNIIGALKSGLFQYTYCYETKDGELTPWFPLAQGINLASSYYVDPSSGKAIENHHKYNMYETGVTTEKAIMLELERLDSRFQYIRFAYVYSKTKDLPHEFVMFKREDISTKRYGDRLSVLHYSHQGEPLDFYELNAVKDYVLSAKTGAIHNNKMFEGNIKLQKPPVIDLSKVRIEPTFRQMVCDETGYAKFENKDDYITNTTPKSHSVSIKLFEDKTGKAVNLNYPTIFEYKNYKGTRWEHLFTSCWRDETYPYALVVGNKKGYPFYAQHIKDYKFPAQSDNINGTGVDARLSLNSGQVRVMGAVFSGIELPKSVLFDENGELQIGYFCIVRAASVRRIMSQGLIMNTVYTPRCTEEDEGGKKRSEIVRPQPFLTNYYYPDISHAPNSTVYGDANNYSTLNGPNAPKINQAKCGIVGTSYSSVPGTFLYHSPDVRVEGKLPDLSPTDYMEMVGTVESVTSKLTALYGHQLHYCIKAYLSSYLTRPTGPTIASKSRLSNSFILGAGGTSKGIVVPMFDLYNLKRDFHAYTEFIVGSGTPGELRFSSLVAPATGLLVAKDWTAVNVGKENLDSLQYHIVNYCKQTDKYFTKEGENSFPNRQYFSTNHFQEITLEVLAQVPQVIRNNETHYVFNGVEVWGGDCFPHLFDTAINYPNYSESCDGLAGSPTTKGHQDVAMSIIAPMESHYNMMMRYGRSLGEVGTQSETAGCDNVLIHQLKGISPTQPEDWNVNDILQHEEKLALYPGMPSNIVFNTKLPSRWIYSKLKTSGQRQDSYRSFLPLNYYDLEGSHGEITGCATAFEYLFSFQENAYGALQINQRAAISAGSGLELILGTGKDLTGIDYVSKNAGSQHRDSIYSNGKQVLWVDARRAAIRRHSQAGGDDIAKMYGLHDFGVFKMGEFEGRDDNDIRICASEDLLNSDVIFSFVNGDRSTSISFNTEQNAFHSFRECAPKMFIRHKKYLFAPSKKDPNDLLMFGAGRYGEYDGELKDTVLRFVVNDNFNIEKVFDCIKINCNKAGYPLIYKAILRTENETHEIDLLNDSRVKYLHSELSFPIFQIEGMEQNSRARARVLDVELFIKNDGVTRVSIQAVETIIRQSYKY